MDDFFAESGPHAHAAPQIHQLSMTWEILPAESELMVLAIHRREVIGGAEAISLLFFIIEEGKILRMVIEIPREEIEAHKAISLLEIPRAQGGNDLKQSQIVELRIIEIRLQ